MMEQVDLFYGGMFMVDQDAQDINNMMSATNNVAIKKASKKSIFVWVVLGCVVLGVGLGVVVYQSSINSVVKPKPTTTPVIRSNIAPVESPTTPVVSEVTPADKNVTFPKAGQLRAYWAPLFTATTWDPLNIVVQISGIKTNAVIAGGSATTMKYVDLGVNVAASDKVAIATYFDNSAELSRGWMLPVNNQCGANGASNVDITSYLTWFSANGGGEPAVSVQCWSDYDPQKNNGTYPPADFNDYLMIWSYTPPVVTSPSPSSVGSPSPSPSRAASPSPSPSRSASPSPSPSRSPSPSPSIRASAIPSTVASQTLSPSPRAAMPDTSEGTPVTGVFEVTVGTVSVGLLLLVLGIFGLLVL